MGDLGSVRFSWARYRSAAVGRRSGTHRRREHRHFARREERERDVDRRRREAYSRLLLHWLLHYASGRHGVLHRCRRHREQGQEKSLVLLYLSVVKYLFFQLRLRFTSDIFF